MRRRLVLPLVGLALGCLSMDFVGPAQPTVVRTRVAQDPGAPLPEAPLPETALAAVRKKLDGYRTGLAPFEKEALARTIVREARRQGQPLELVLAVMHVESRFNPYAVSPVGALGLMQLLPSTAEEVALAAGIPWRGPRSLFDPATNVALGVAYLRWLSERYDSVDAVLAAYNWGPGRIDRRLRAGHPLPVEYVRDVRAAYGGATPSS